MAHRVVRRERSQRRQTLWIASQPASTALASASTGVFLSSLNAAALALRPFTIVRTRGRIFLRSDQLATSEDYDVAYGMTVVTDQASAVGVTAIPTPINEMESDWFVYEQLVGRFSFATSAAFNESGVGKDFDSKAMRKVDLGSDMVVVAEPSAVADGQVLWDSFRMLIKLH